MLHKVIDYVDDGTLTAEQNARGRLSHYQSEMIRLQAVDLSQSLNKHKLEPTDDKGR